MKISVIAIFYNSEQYVRKCIESIAAQKNVDVELIAVDDCSTDRTYQIVDIEKPLYLWNDDRNFRKEILGELQSVNDVVTSTKGFPRFNRMIHKMIAWGMPDTVIRCVSEIYVRTMHYLNRPL